MSVLPILLAATVLSAAPDAQVSVAKFKGDAPGAFCFTFDDALPSQLIYAVPSLNQAGLKASFYLITRNVADGAGGAPAIGKPTVWADWKTVADSGHEIGSHTLTHPDLTQMNAADAAKELAESAQAIKDKLGLTPVTVAYPYNAWNVAVVKLALQTYPLGGRMSQVGYGDAAGFAKTTEAMNKYADEAVTGKSLVIGMIHGLTEPYAPMDPAPFLEHLKYCRKLSDDGKLWVATFGEIRRYQIEKDSTRISAQSSSTSKTSFTLESPLNAALFNAPLTFIVPFPGAADAPVKAVREGSADPLPVKAEAGRILVQAVPIAGTITVDWSGSTALAGDHGGKSGEGAPKPSGGKAQRAGSPTVKAHKGKYLISGKSFQPAHK
jgi:peptidoglycan/xylan/chitin deacetylase (PgdA/CDA1 family)